jgi:hypothetical protein
MIAYGRLIDTWVEISTLSETNNAQFFSEPESLRFIASRTAAYVDRYDTVRIPWFTFNFRRYLEEPKALLKNSGIEEHGFWILDLSNCSDGSRLPAHDSRSLCIYRVN